MWQLFLPYVGLVTVWILVFKVHVPWNRPEQSKRSALLKILPILYLGLLTAVTPAVSLDHSWLRRYITVGLMFSLGGDWCLTWFKKHFVPGVFCFALAHVAYIAAFGLYPATFDTVSGVFLCIALGMTAIICTRIPKLSLSLVVGCYILLICAMGWRASVFHQERGSDMSLVICLGALTFMVSDTCIAISQWVKPWPRSTFVIMITYYIAQALLASAVLWPSYRVFKQKPNFKL